MEYKIFTSASHEGLSKKVNDAMGANNVVFVGGVSMNVISREGPLNERETAYGQAVLIEPKENKGGLRSLT